MFVFDKGEDDQGLAKWNRAFFFFKSVKVRDGNSSSRQSHWLLAMSNCFVLDATWARQCSLFLSHMHTHPLGSAPAPVTAQGEPNCCFSSLGSEVSKCVKCTCVPVSPQLLENTLGWTGKMASGNVLNVWKVENMGGVGEPVWDRHCSLKRVKMEVQRPDLCSRWVNAWEIAFGLLQQ